MAVLSGVLNATGFKESWDVIEQATPQSPLKDSAYFVYENWNLSLITGGSDSRA